MKSAGFVEDILDGMNKAEILLEGVSYSQFKTDFRINFAVVRALEIIGEAAKRSVLSSITCGRSTPIHSGGWIGA